MSCTMEELKTRELEELESIMRNVMNEIAFTINKVQEGRKMNLCKMQEQCEDLSRKIDIYRHLL